MSSKDRWIKVVNDWKKSGEIAKHWCKKHKVSYVSFITWRKKINLSSSIKGGETSSFIEVVEREEKYCDVKIEFQGFVLRLSKGFDEAMVRKCLKLIKNL